VPERLRIDADAIPRTYSMNESDHERLDVDRIALESSPFQAMLPGGCRRAEPPPFPGR